MKSILRKFVAAPMFALCMANASHADQNNSELDALFERLLITENIREAAEITQDIWRNWYQNDDSGIVELMGQGEISTRTARYDEAIALYSKVIALDPQFAEGWNRRATVYYLMGEYDLSTVDVAKTLELEPRHFGALSGQGMIYLRQDKYRQAIGYLERALQINPHMTNIKDSIELIEKQLEEDLI